jgi:hypothetical protein
VKQTHQNQLEKYLKNATRGLWGKRKLEVREELESHILEKAHKHELLGLAREDAISKSMQELGNARVINHKMTEVYMLPKQLLLGGFCVCVLASFGIWQMTRATVLRLECSNADQTFHFSGTTSSTYSRFNLPDKSVLLAAIRGPRWTSTNNNTTFYVDDDGSGVQGIQMQATKASFEAFDFNNVDMKSVSKDGKSDPEIRCEFK